MNILDLIAPRTCCICHHRLGANEHIVCTVCLMHLPQTDFLDDVYHNALAQTFWGRVRHFEKAFAFIYHLPHADSANPVYQLKYGKDPDMGIDLGRYIAEILARRGFFDDIDALLPVPLASKRYKERGYNQSEMIALGLHEVSHLPILNKVVKRKTFDSSQTNKDRWDRTQNVENAFQVVDAKKINDKHLLIIDDIVTTGATISSLANELEKHASVRISVVSLAFAQSSLTMVTSSKSFK